MDGVGQIGGFFADVAWKMGHGEGFAITFSTYMAMMLFERLAYVFEPEHQWNERDAISNVVNATFTAIVEGVLLGALFIGVYVWLFEHARLFTIPFVWWGWVLAFLLNDLAYYADHRVAHRTGFFWAIHTPHHSSQEMNLLVSNRCSLFSLAGLTSPCYLLLPILGLHPAMFLAAKFFGNLWGIFNHTRLVRRLGWLENWLCTPANHRVHHGTEAKYLDRNYGQTLLIWDRMFGTFQPEEETPTFGLVEQMNSYRIWDIQTWGVRVLWQKLRAAPSWGDRWHYLIKPPGWSHDGRHTTSETIRAQAA
jgi:sterol desaturase/sphingolipid hydroxylase (fatty acid hydroxylase superfamily)